MEESTTGIPTDILRKLEADYVFSNDFKTALEIIAFIRQDTLNVGWIQLSRAVILIANGDIKKMKEIVDSRYHGDPRDVLMESMGLSNNTNNYGLIPFEFE